MSAVAAPAELTVKSFDGESAGTEQLALKVADRSTANGLVHRYLITVRQNNRAVRLHSPSRQMASSPRRAPPPNPPRRAPRLPPACPLPVLTL